MFSYIHAILNSENPKYIVLQLLFIMAIIYLVIKWYQTLVKPFITQEGFHQNEAYIIKRNQDIYDDFYTEVYDELHDTEERCQKELIQIIKTTEPSTQDSVFLDVGSGTGYTVSQLREAGYRAYGIDKSNAMVEHSEKKYPEAEYKCGDVAEPMNFESATFTHILCTHFTIYHIEDKKTFFQNCYHWMKPNGYLILHLADRAEFDATMPIDEKSNAWKPLQRLYGIRTTETNVEFADYTYKATYKFPTSNSAAIATVGDSTIVLTETFTDKQTQHIRQNEYTMSMESIDTILDCAKKNGFLIHAKYESTKYGGKDKHQYMYILERPL